MNQMPQFAAIAAPRPTPESLAADHAAVTALLDQHALPAALEHWDAARRSYDTWSALTHLAFSRDTTDAAATAERDHADRMGPVATGHDVAIKRRLLAMDDRDTLLDLVGPHVIALWDCDITTFDPAIAADLEREAQLCSRYTALLAPAKVTVRGNETNLSGLAPFGESLDRSLRHEAEQARWSFFAAHATELDELFDQLVHLRHDMAVKLGFENHVALGYRRMRRVDYGPDQVARFRDDVRTHVVPLMQRLLEERRVSQGWDTLRAWDENLIDPAGNPKPIGDHDLLVAEAASMFDALDPEFGGFYRMLRDGGFMDLRNRPGKAGGGFCTSFPTDGMPFIFANFNGTHHDINVFTHEMGHAFQNWKSRDLDGIDVLWPTMEAAEITSMALEFLTYPHIDRMVGADQADRYRRMHLIGSLAFLPYGVCVDHFQHEIYQNPSMTPAERNATWKRLEAIYLPWRDYGDLAHPAGGGRWQSQLHIYRLPFYYIDYALALSCAMQLWTLPPDDAIARYRRLAARGGAAPFTGLIEEIGLASPFEPGTLAGVVEEACAFLK